LLLGDRYRALQPISQGGIGRTFLAVDEQESSKPRCIIKQFSLKNQGTNNAEKAAESFRQEAVRLQELGQHPQIPQLLACFEQDDRTCIPAALVQTYIEGESLAQTLEAEGVFSETQIRQILNELLPVLQFVHDHGVIHRDINPDNIIRRTSPVISSPYQGGVEIGSPPLPRGGWGGVNSFSSISVQRNSPQKQHWQELEQSLVLLPTQLKSN
jgi:serine/threonine protein kinase